MLLLRRIKVNEFRLVRLWIKKNEENWEDLQEEYGPQIALLKVSEIIAPYIPRSGHIWFSWRVA